MSESVSKKCVVRETKNLEKWTILTRKDVHV